MDNGHEANLKMFEKDGFEKEIAIWESKFLKDQKYVLMHHFELC